jgi:NitT/TauT family transport system permease protein
MGLGVATLAALLVGLVLGVLPPVRATLGPLVTGIAVIPPIALLPILFIALGLGETAKIALIVIGIAPVMVRDIAAHVAALPREQIIKAQTLGASSWQIMVRVALPQAMPRLFHAMRLSLGPAWVFLISAEAIASDVGLGYRIFLVRRYLSMDVIIPYVAWIALLAVAMDLTLTFFSERLFPWAHGASH